MSLPVLKNEPQSSSKKIPRVYHGSLASVMACCCTHPLDLIKVHLQTSKLNHGLLGQSKVIFKMGGVKAFYSGLTASMARQVSYSGTRFAVYDTIKSNLTNNQRNLESYEKVICAVFAGSIGGFCGTPTDLVNVRMQNDSKLSPSDPKRRNYKHVFDGLLKIHKNEGGKVLMSGYQMATVRCALMSVGQIAMYDTIKEFSIETLNLPDILPIHLACSGLAGICGAFLTMPFDVMKTKLMNAKKNEFSSVGNAILKTYKSGGFLIFYAGFLPAAIRIVPQTVLLWVFKEQLRLNFGDNV